MVTFYKFRTSLYGVILLIAVLGILWACQDESQLEDEIRLMDAPTVVTQVNNASIGDGMFIIINRNSGKALDVVNGSLINGGNVAQYSNYNNENQKWLITANADGFYSIINLKSGKALDVSQSSTSDGANVLQWHYWGGTNQQWDFVSVGDGYYRITNRNSGKSLDIASQSTENLANLLQWSYWGGSNQQWSLIQLGTGDGNGQLSWTLTSSGVPEDTQDRITVAMNAAVMRYNAGNDWPSRTLTVEYNTGVATADANVNGHIRFGSSSTYQNQRTALHEIAHTYGSGLSSGFNANVSGGVFTGVTTDALVKSYDGASAVISVGGQHFWPYGLNYNNEMSETNAQRHVQIIKAMKADGM